MQKSDNDTVRLDDQTFAMAMDAVRHASNSQLQAFTPGVIAFGMDMFLDLALVTDLITLQEGCQVKIDEHL